ncbi:MAG TPA: GNAT family N-acetyltransferase [Blastocatellia bacterium]|jgi:RimJ/RimL family protein N-acetyltransferase|nr:GNAT family N-acetyltransferase [Blastocatellia bacterium]
MKQHRIETDRLVLRPFALSDAAEVQRLAGDEEIAYNALNIPSPFTTATAEQWITGSLEEYREGRAASFAVTLRPGDSLIGAVGLSIDETNLRAEMGYWIDKTLWGRGYASEAAEAVMRYGFEELALNRIYASCLKRNPASGRVLRKIGMSLEGCLRQHVRRSGSFEDLEEYGILIEEYIARRIRKQVE